MARSARHENFSSVADEIFLLISNRVGNLRHFTKVYDPYSGPGRLRDYFSHASQSEKSATGGILFGYICRSDRANRQFVLFLHISSYSY